MTLLPFDCVLPKKREIELDFGNKQWNLLCLDLVPVHINQTTSVVNMEFNSDFTVLQKLFTV